jgi:hypothetical protein
MCQTSRKTTRVSLAWQLAPIAGFLAGACAVVCTGIPLVRAEEPNGGAEIAVSTPEETALLETAFRVTVEPILRRRCYGCHSHDAGVMEGGLALDWQAGWAAGGARGPAILPGDPDGSLLMRAVRHQDSELRMPDEKLPANEIEALEVWIRAGAFDPRTTPSSPAAGISNDWWSLQPLQKPLVPPVAAEAQVAVGENPIDAFVFKQLQENSLTFAPEADRRSLIRRLTFDLHGLPPTPDEVDAFLGDRRPDAVARLIDGLLDSPRYGERWARHWLDTIHFADSHGFEHDAFRPNAWRYRDYVIESFNADLAWGQFVREQLAVDVFAPQATDRLIALGYLGAGPYDHSAASTAPRNFEHLDRDDLVTQTLGAFASTTASCARCHAHKFDPISQEDYYALQAVFAGIGKGDVAYDADPAVAVARKRWNQVAADAGSEDPAVVLSESNVALVADWEASHAATAVWQPLNLAVVASGHGAELVRQDDGSVLSGGQRPDVESTTVVATTDLAQITAVRLDVMPDPSLPMQGPGRTDNGNLHLSEFSLRVVTPTSPEGRPVAIGQATADFNQDGWTISHAIDGNRKTAWGIYPAVGEPHYAVFELQEPLQLSADAQLVLQLEQVHGGGHVIGRFAMMVTDADPQAAVAVSSEVRHALARPAAERSLEERIAVAATVLGHRARRELAALPAQDMFYAAATVAENERGVIEYSEPREIRVLKRGNIDAPGDEVGPGALSCLPELAKHFELPAGHEESARRAALAAWLTDPANPLTWRSIVNRVWHFHFGQGLCSTPGDFGRMGSEPSHPQLLDWLAAWFRDSGGSLKDLHRLICTSRTYRQASCASFEAGAAETVLPDALKHDPDNRLLARANRRRLDADGLRDAILAVSGQLDLTMGGPGDQHFSQTPGPQLTPVLDYTDVDWSAAGMQRRSIYRVVWRGIPDPFFEAFDFPDLGLVVARRGESVSPLQSLTLRNNRFVLHHAESMAADLEATDGDEQAQVIEAVRRVWLRRPTADELALLQGLASSHGMAAVCRLLLNSNEFLFID